MARSRITVCCNYTNVLFIAASSCRNIAFLGAMALVTVIEEGRRSVEEKRKEMRGLEEIEKQRLKKEFGVVCYLESEESRAENKSCAGN